MLEALFDAVMPGLLRKILTKKVLNEEVWSQLITDEDSEEYRPAFFSEKTTAHYQCAPTLPGPS